MKFFVTFAGDGRDAGYGTGGLDASRGAIAGRFAPVLARLGEVIQIDTPARGVAKAARSRVPAVHWCHALPHELPEDAGAETWAVFGLGLAACPTRPFGGRPGTDWRTRLARCGGALCFSTHAAEAVRALMGGSFPVLAVPPPLDCTHGPAPAPVVLKVDGAILDTASWPETGPPDLPAADADDEDAPWPDPAALQRPSAWTKTARYRLGITRLHLVHVYREAFRDLLPPPLARVVSHGGRAGTRAARRLLALRQRPASPLAQPGQAEAGPPAPSEFEAWQTGQVAVSLSGLVFAAVHGAWDRAWGDALSAFVEICRADASATLVIRTFDLDDAARAGLAAHLRRLGPFDCRMVLIDGAIEGGLDRLIAASHFYLCASPGEAAPLPAMRFMAAGRPAIAPCHSALADFVSARTAFLAEAGIEYEAFPGDVEERLDATGWRLDWESLCRGIGAARALAHDPAAYAERSATVTQTMQAFCGPEAVLAALSRWGGRSQGLAA